MLLDQTDEMDPFIFFTENVLPHLVCRTLSHKRILFISNIVRFSGFHDSLFP